MPTSEVVPWIWKAFKACKATVKMFDNQGKGGKNGMDADVGGEEAIAGTRDLHLIHYDSSHVFWHSKRFCWASVVSILQEIPSLHHKSIAFNRHFCFVACGAASALPPDPAILFAGTKTSNVEPLAYRSHPEDVWKTTYGNRCEQIDESD